jgi:hypothetical protein
VPGFDRNAPDGRPFRGRINDRSAVFHTQSMAARPTRQQDRLKGAGQLSDKLLEGEVFDTLLEVRVLIERYRARYDTVRPHSSLGYRPTATQAIVPWGPPLAASLLGPAPMGGAVGALT